MKQMSICLLASLLSTVAIAVLAFVILILFSVSTAQTGGIAAVSGGISNKVFLLLIVSLPILLVGFFFLFRRGFRTRR